MRKLSGSFIALILMAVFAGCACAQESFTLKIGCVLDAQHPVLFGLRRMAKVAESESAGRLKLNIYPSSQLGGQREVLQNVQAGVVDGLVEATATLTNFVPQLGVVDLPYLAKDEATAFRMFDSPVFEMLANTLFLSERLWQRLPDDLKAIIRKASAEGRKTVVAERAARNAKAMDEIRAAGAAITQPDLTPFIAVGQQTYQELAQRLGPDLVDRIVGATK